MADKKVVKKKKTKKNIVSGMAYIQATFNNTMVTITDDQAIVLPGHLQALKVLRVRENPHLMLHKWQLKMQEIKLRNLV